MRHQLKIKNESSQGIIVTLRDRLMEIHTTSMVPEADLLPGMGVLETWIDPGEMIVLTSGGLTIRSLEAEKENSHGR